MGSNKRAPQADNFKIAGPLMPQWVISKGPSLSKIVFPVSFKTLTEASVLRPGNSFILVSSILKVNNDGTGGMIVWFKASNSFHIFGLLPVATTNFSAENASEGVFIFQKAC